MAFKGFENLGGSWAWDEVICPQHQPQEHWRAWQVKCTLPHGLKKKKEGKPLKPFYFSLCLGRWDLMQEHCFIQTLLLLHTGQATCAKQFSVITFPFYHHLLY